MEIREEQSEDHSEIHRLTSSAFAGLAHSNGSEPDIIDSLLADGDLTLSLVALMGPDLIGHIAFSLVRIGTYIHDWYGLGPVSVRPDLQRSGVGSALINEGLRIIKNMCANGCALIGDPNYYFRFGFVSDGSVRYGDLPARYVQWKSFGEQRPKGALLYSRAFNR